MNGYQGAMPQQGAQRSQGGGQGDIPISALLQALAGGQGGMGGPAEQMPMSQQLPPELEMLLMQLESQGAGSGGMPQAQAGGGSGMLEALLGGGSHPMR